MRIALTIIIGIHAIIHLFGFLKAFGLIEFNAISQPISRTFGILWLAAFILFTASVVLLSRQFNYWWVVGILAIILSQFLIMAYWGEAKFGTILNLIILISILIAYSTSSFKNKVNDETAQMLAGVKTSQKMVSGQMIEGLPSAVQRWLLKSGIVGNQIIQSVFLEQDLEMLMNPEQKEWSNAKAKQYITTEPPAFNWFVDLKMKSFMDVIGRDKFVDGKGAMAIKLFSVIPIVDVKNNEKINQATLQRYLAEIVWFPSVALSNHITWVAIDDHSAKATMNYHGTNGSGVFHFDKNGDFKKFIAMRYKDVDENSEPEQWTVSATKTEVRNRVNIPVELKASWKLENGDWTWLVLKIRNIEYNAEQMPIANK